jgi:hypothetical protein
VLRALLIIMEEFGGVPMGSRPPPAKLVNAAQRELVKPLAHNAVAALQVRGLIIWCCHSVVRVSTLLVNILPHCAWVGEYVVVCSCFGC